MTPLTAIPWTLTARWILPVSGPPLAHGLLTIAGERIVSVAPRDGRSADVDLGEVAVLPGLVNAHTHLDLTGLRGRCPPSADFTSWLRQVVAHRRNGTPEQTQADIRAAIAECLRYGTTLVGDIAAGGASWDALAEAPLRAVVFYELIGLPLDRAEQAAAAAAAWLDGHRFLPACRPGLSPHAPYSVGPYLLQRALRLAGQFRTPLACHLAETREEYDLLVWRSGPFVAFLKEVGVWAEGRLARGPLLKYPTEMIRAFNKKRVPKLFIHCNHLSPKGAAIHRSGTVVYCPRTHAAFGHPPHPFRDFLARGIRVAIGTDSLASNPDLSILAEIRHVHRQCPDVPGELLLRMATLAGAEALGWADETGSVEAGKSADLVVVPLLPGDNRDPYEGLLDSDLPVERVLCRGQWVQTLT